MKEKKYISADLLIDGQGNKFKDGIIEIEGSEITVVGQSEDVEIPDNAEVHHTPVAMPGLWDCHTHMLGGRSTDMLKWMEEPTSLRAMRTTRSTRNLIKAGYTTVRDVGGPYALRLKSAINEGVIPGPSIYAAHKFISQTAGHGDHHTTNLKWQSQEFVDWYSKIADGVAECRKAARENIREGADLIKIFVTGGVFSHIDAPTQAHYSMAELEAIIQEAARFDLPTSAHAHGLEGIRKAIDAGITTVEHGTYLDEETAELMVEKDVILVPTMLILKLFIDHAEELQLPDHIMSKANDTYEVLQKNVEMAVEKGVKIAAGSDLLGLSDLMEHGHQNASELEWLNNAGLTPMQAIKAATSMGPKTLGQQEPKSGSIQAGYDADILCLFSNPLDDLSILQDKTQIGKVFKGGEVVAETGEIIE